jgi:hypothetical protein
VVAIYIPRVKKACKPRAFQDEFTEYINRLTPELGQSFETASSVFLEIPSLTQKYGYILSSEPCKEETTTRIEADAYSQRYLCLDVCYCG